MMGRMLLCIWIASLVYLSTALDAVRVIGNTLVNNATNGTITINGIWYGLSNSTTDPVAQDPLTDASACTRDAAILDTLRINTIYVAHFSPSQNHDECFSVFNSVGIYVVVMLRYPAFPDPEKNASNEYTTDKMRTTFEIIDAVKDYDNLLAFDVGIFPHDQDMSNSSETSEIQNLMRAFIRDTKEYISKHTRQILVGVTASLTLNPAENYYFLTCVDSNLSPDFSRADYVSYTQVSSYSSSAVDGLNLTLYNLLEDINIDDATVPVWLSQYGGEEPQNPDAETVNMILTTGDTQMLYNDSLEFLPPYGSMSGAARFEYANVRLTDPTDSFGIVHLESDGSIQYTSTFESLRTIFEQHNTDYWLSGKLISTTIETKHRACDAPYAGPYNKTITPSDSLKIPQRPEGLDQLIINGAGGTAGKMVDVTVTMIKYTVKDSKGSTVTDLVLKPSKSAARSAATATGTSPSSTSQMSTGAKTGIGIGIGVGGLFALAVAGFFLFRRRRHRRLQDSIVAKQSNAESGNDSDGKMDEIKYHKAELATGPEVEAQPPVELPAGKSPQEVTSVERHSGGFPGIGVTSGGPPVELPVKERVLELPALKQDLK